MCDQSMATTDQVGERIRRRRMEMGLNLRQLAEKTGVSASFISQVEHGKVNASLGSLQHISEALDVPLLYFVKEKSSEEGMASNQIVEPSENTLVYQPVIHADARPQMFFPFSGVSYELLVPGFGQKLVAFLCKFAPGTENVVRKLREPTEEFIYVVSGNLTVGLESGRYELGPEIRYIFRQRAQRNPMRFHKGGCSLDICDYTTSVLINGSNNQN